MKSNREIFNRVYDILVEHCGADERERMSFLYAHDSGNEFPCREYRFCGIFGFGGKFRNTGNRFYVDYYPEHATIELDAIRDKVNQLFLEMSPK